LLLIALYERQSKITGGKGLSDIVNKLAEKTIDTLPRPIRRLSTFPYSSMMCESVFLILLTVTMDRLAGSDADIDAVSAYCQNM
jgi:hypothetical protein